MRCTRDASELRPEPRWEPGSNTGAATVWLRAPRPARPPPRPPPRPRASALHGEPHSIINRPVPALAPRNPRRALNSAATD